MAAFFRLRSALGMRKSLEHMKRFLEGTLYVNLSAARTHDVPKLAPPSAWKSRTVLKPERKKNGFT